MVDVESLLLIIKALKGKIRVNTSNQTVEVFNEYGTRMVLRDLDTATYEAFKNNGFQSF